jgi:hypothetical protein
MHAPDGFAGNVLTASREAVAPAAVFGRAEEAVAGVQGGVGKPAVEDEPGLLSPSVLPPTAQVKLERGGSLLCAGEEVRQQGMTTGSSSGQVPTGTSFGQIPANERSTLSSRQVR